VNCATCHSGDMFTDMNYYNLLVPQLGPGKGNGTSGREDYGRANVSFDWRDRYQFRTAPLRNVAITAPYFHSGAYDTLEDVIWHHANVWQSAQQYDPSQSLPQTFYSSFREYDFEAQAPYVAADLAQGLPLSHQDVADLITFLESLTDASASDLSHFVPQTVPSGLPLDPVPEEELTTHHSNSEPESVSETIDPSSEEATNWHFVNVAQEVGLNFTHGAFQFDIYEDPAAMMGAGLCWLDYDNDGWLDLYLVNSHAEEEADLLADALPQNRLFRNVEGLFVDVSNETGTALAVRGNGCVAADFNVDGWDDLYLTVDGSDRLLMNQGDGTFVDETTSAGLGASEWTSAVSVGDLNRDGLPDLFVGAYISLDNKIPNPMGAFPQDYFGLPDHLYIHDGIAPDGSVHFTEVTADVGLIREERTLGSIMTDVDLDGDLDLYIANDGQPNRLYENVPVENDAIGFRFVDLVDSAQVGDAGSGMGVTSGDYDGDGYFDLLVTNWEAELNALYRNETADNDYISFRYSTFRIGMRGLGNDQTGWGVALADFDHDTDLDMMNVNGRVPVSNFTTDPELVQLYGNYLVEQGRPTFLPWTQRVGLSEIGPLLARGSAIADYDNDGDLDIAINTIRGEAVLLENRDVTGNWLLVSGDLDAGTKVIVTLPDGRELIRELHTGSSYLSSEDPRLHFGLGNVDVVPQVTIYLSDNRSLALSEVAANQIVSLHAFGTDKNSE